MKKAILILTMLVFCAGFSLAYQVSRQEFTIKIDELGFSQVTEKYYLAFSNRDDFNAFNEAYNRNGQRLDAWTAFDLIFTPPFDSIEGMNNLNVSKSQTFTFSSKEKYIEFKYNSDKPTALMEKSTDARSEHWTIRTDILAYFQQVGTLLNIPKNTSIEIILPSTAEITSELPPNTKIGKNTIKLSNLSVSIFSIKYLIPKPIAQIAVFSEFYEWLKSTGLIYAIIAVIIVLGIVGVVKRKEIVDKVENYIVDHSEISRKEEFEEIDIED